MAKDISRLLQKGNLTPKERLLLRVANLVSIERTGKSILTESDKYTLIDGWQPTNPEEVREFNRYNQAWKTAMFAESDAQIIYLQAKLKYQSMQGLLNSFMPNPFYSEIKKAIEELGKIERVSAKAKEAIDIINRRREEKLKQGEEKFFSRLKFLMDMRDDFIKNYCLLLGFEEFFKRLSKAYDMDLSYRVSAWIAECKESVEVFNKTLLDTLKTNLLYSTKKKKHYKGDELFIDTKKIKPNRERVEPAFKEVGEVFGDTF